MSQSVPAKRIYDANDVIVFKSSIAYAKLNHIIQLLVQKVGGIDVRSNVLNLDLVTNKVKSENAREPLWDKDEIDVKNQPAVLVGVLTILSRLNELITLTPPAQGPRRFGNMNCRVWHDKIEEEVDFLLKANLPIKDTTELKYYLLNSFGSRMRLDYGTGHELSFIAFIGGLIQLDILNLDEISGLDLLEIFASYYDITKRLILDYSLEPAGSHGVWGLDDHFHFIYILGASEFIDNKLAPPVQQVLSATNINFLKSSNLYVNSVAFIYKIKTGPFKEHSPIIYDIHSTVYLWKKVLKGLLKMYEVEVLSKFPVVQHFWFSNVLYPWKDREENDLPFKDVLEEDPVKAPLKVPLNIPMTGAPWARR